MWTASSQIQGRTQIRSSKTGAQGQNGAICQAFSKFLLSESVFVEIIKDARSPRFEHQDTQELKEGAAANARALVVFFADPRLIRVDSGLHGQAEGALGPECRPGAKSVDGVASDAGIRRIQFCLCAMNSSSTRKRRRRGGRVERSQDAHGQKDIGWFKRFLRLCWSKVKVEPRQASRQNHNVHLLEGGRVLPWENRRQPAYTSDMCPNS